VHDSHPAITQIMKFAGHQLHLAGHSVSSQFLYAAGDVEVHFETEYERIPICRFTMAQMNGCIWWIWPARCPRRTLESARTSSFYPAQCSFAVSDQSLPSICSNSMSNMRTAGRRSVLVCLFVCFFNLSLNCLSDALTNWGACSSAHMHNSRVQHATKYLVHRARQLADWLVQQVDLKSSFSQVCYPL